LLAEANQWPEDAQEYFGQGDECHMSFHFPLMPRMYMAIAKEDRFPIVDIMRQTPDIPANCQWAIFLRNHDELTLEMVTSAERDYLWETYAADRRARINLGIRRRLAPLLERDRRRIELMNGLLFSMPGTPVLYYGDEIGMGDNIHLGDRDGVRTPMQWSPDRNGGFSLADPAYLFLPSIMDPIYGYQAVNVEAQRRNPNSQLNWTRQLINATRTQRAFGRGSLRFIRPANRKVLVYIREHEGETVLCVANLSRSPQAVEIDLKEFAGRLPVELLGHSQFPRVGELSYMLTLPAYGFYWFRLIDETIASDWVEAAVQPMPDLETVVMPKGWSSLVEGSARQALERRVLPAFLRTQRWFGEKSARDLTIEIADQVAMAAGSLVVLKSTADGAEHHHLMGLEIAWESGNEDPLQRLLACSLARVRRGPRVGVLYEAMGEESFVRELVAGIQQGSEQPTAAGRLRFTRTAALPDLGPIEDLAVKRLGAEQSNTSVLVGSAAVLKAIRTPAPGQHPEAEVSRFLTEVSPFANTPPLFGTIELEQPDGGSMTLGVLQGRIENQGDGWTVTLDFLGRLIADVRLLPVEEADEAGERFGYYTELARRLGTRTGELHRAFAASTGDAAFDPEPVGRAEREQWLGGARDMLEKALVEVGAARSRLEGEAAAAADALTAARRDLLALPKALLPTRIAAQRSRLHGDYHLGQVLVAKNDFYILDFEGEPARPLAERRAKNSPLKDVAGMLRSFDYAAHAALAQGVANFSENADRIGPWMDAWRLDAEAAFLAGYRDAAAGAATVPEDAEEFGRLLDFFLLEKAAYEVVYEARNRPDWLAIPIRGLLALAGRERTS
jgi:maltose alpha-D-glucosyltransferase/alpha-amylase